MSFSTSPGSVPRSEDAPTRRSKFSDAELERRRERMKRLNAEGRTGGVQFGKLGGRPRRGETREQARLRREKERETESLERLLEVRRPVVKPYEPSRAPLDLSDEEVSARRAFLTSHGHGRVRGYAVRRTSR